MARALEGCQEGGRGGVGRKTYAHTWLPCSGTTVKRSWSLLSWSQTSLPMEFREAVSPVEVSIGGFQRLGRCSLTGESADVLDVGLEPHDDEASRALMFL